MANIVELRNMSNEDILDLLEDAREEMFNLRFQKAQGSLENVARLKQVRREIAQFNELLGKRAWSIEEAQSDSSVAAALEGKSWTASSSYVYEDGVWTVDFIDEDGKELATVDVDLNKKRRRTRRSRNSRPPVNKVVKVEVV